MFTGGNRQWNFISRGSRGRMGAPSSLSTQGGAVPAAAAPFHPAKHWCLVVPLSWMALISALSWGRLIPTVLTLSPVLHCDTGHRREAQHPHFSKFQHHLWCHWIPIWSQRKKKTKKKQPVKFKTSVGHSCTSLSRIHTHFKYAAWHKCLNHERLNVDVSNT